MDTTEKRNIYGGDRMVCYSYLKQLHFCHLAAIENETKANVVTVSVECVCHQTNNTPSNSNKSFFLLIFIYETKKETNRVFKRIKK